MANVKTAAAAIRPLLTTEPPPVSSEEQFVLAFLVNVCKELGLDPTPVNIKHVEFLLKKAGVEKVEPEPYPQMLSERDARNRLVAKKWPENHPTHADQDVVFASKEEADFYNAHGGKGLNQADLDALTAAEAAASGGAPPPPKPAHKPAPPAENRK